MKKFRIFLLLGGIAASYVFLFFAATTFPLPHAGRPFLIYSNQSRQDIKLTLCTGLRQAKKSIALMMYGITDPEVIALLSEKISQGVPTQIRYDKKASLGLLAKLPSSADALPVASKGLMHRKILILDDALVFLGSANLTTASLKHHDNLVIGLFHPELAFFLRGGQGQSFSFEIGGMDATLWLLPDRENRALEELIATLERAREKIHIAMFTLTHGTIGDALVRAKERGVDVQVALDYYTARGASFKIVQRLKEAGVSVLLSRGQELLHHKWAWIDGHALIMGSANWTQAAFAKNEDFLLFFPDLVPKHRAFLNALWRAIEQESFEQN